ncbi:MAG TPA: DNA translocase FtsK 4TM domain-containing protein, partial [Patescibacteria group bacterium]|nr:DNA translocase FtsK 4TM domain-containing protein [Patescibacteria group bacterium]
MGRPKKIKNNPEEDKKLEKKPKLNIAGEAKRSAVAVLLFALSAVMILGFLGSSGVVGEKINQICGLLLGWAKFIFPVFLIIAGIVLLFRKEKSFYVTKIIGLSAVLLALVSFFHWFFEIKEMGTAANDGLGGGYIGFALAYILTKYLGSAGSLVIIIMLFFIGIIVAFNFSIISIIEKLKKTKEDELEGEKQLDGVAKGSEESAQEISAETKAEDKEKEELEKSNIKKIEFVEGPDQYISSALTNGDGEAREIKGNFGRRPTNMAGKRGKNKWLFPPLDLLEESTGVAKGGDVEKNAEIIQKTLHNFGIEVEKGEIKTGPAVTQYSFRPAVGVKISKILALQNDLSLALAAHPIRIEAPIPGKSLVGVEVPNKVSAIVRLREILETQEFKFRKSSLTLALGKDVSG